MVRKFCREFNTHLLWDMSLRKIQNTDIFGTKNDLFTEYTVLSSTVHCLTIPLLDAYGLDDEIDFYLNLDKLTYLPFDKLGYEYLNGKLKKDNSNVKNFKYEKIMQIFGRCFTKIDDSVKDEIQVFLSRYYDDTFDINVMNLAIITLRLFHRFVTLMHFGGSFALMTIQDKVHEIWTQIKKDVLENGLKEININAYLPKLDESNRLSDEMVEYIELCLERQALE